MIVQASIITKLHKFYRQCNILNRKNMNGLITISKYVTSLLVEKLENAQKE